MTTTKRLFAPALIILMLAMGFTKGFSQTTTTLTPVADTDTQSDVAAGTNSTLSASMWNTLYLKFNLSAISGNVTSAKLRIYKTDVETATLKVNGASPDSWVEGGVKPTTGSQITTTTYSSSTGYIETTVTNVVAAEIAGDKLISFALTTDNGAWTYFNSRESSTNKPELVISYTNGTGGTNIALGKPISASSVEGSSFAAGNANDGSLTSRWSSAYSAPQWIQIDLGPPIISVA